MFFKKKGMQKAQKSLQPERSETEDNIPDALSSVVGDTVNKTFNAFGDIGTGIFEQLLNGGAIPEKPQKQEITTKSNEQISRNPDQGSIFNFGEIENRRQIQEIQQLIEAIKKEVQSIKQAGSSLMSEVSDIEKLTINTMPEKPGVYHIRFLEIILKILHTLKLKINESGSWMEALRSKKAKRGSAFMANSKKKGTQYSMSEEIKMTRSVQ